MGATQDLECHTDQTHQVCSADVFIWVTRCFSFKLKVSCHAAKTAGFYFQNLGIGLVLKNWGSLAMLGVCVSALAPTSCGQFLS